MRIWHGILATLYMLRPSSAAPLCMSVLTTTLPVTATLGQRVTSLVLSLLQILTDVPHYHRDAVSQQLRPEVVEKLLDIFKVLDPSSVSARPRAPGRPGTACMTPALICSNLATGASGEALSRQAAVPMAALCTAGWLPAAHQRLAWQHLLGPRLSLLTTLRAATGRPGGTGGLGSHVPDHEGRHHAC